MYLKGEGVTEDAKKAVEYFRLGVDKGNSLIFCVSISNWFSEQRLVVFQY